MIYETCLSPGSQHNRDIIPVSSNDLIDCLISARRYVSREKVGVHIDTCSTGARETIVSISADGKECWSRDWRPVPDYD